MKREYCIITTTSLDNDVACWLEKGFLTHIGILRLWNYLARQERDQEVEGLIEVRKFGYRTIRMISESLKLYGEKNIKLAILNYHKLVTHPRYYRSFYDCKWTLYNFLACGSVDRFLDWEIIYLSYLEKCQKW